MDNKNNIDDARKGAIEESTNPKTISYEAYEELSKQLVELTGRFNRLFALYNKMVEFIVVGK